MPAKGGKWSPERRAAASAAAKARIGGTAVQEAPNQEAPTNGVSGKLTYEQPPRKFKRPKDGFHYVLVEKNPTQSKDDDLYQGDAFYEADYDLCPDLGTRRWDVYRLPMATYQARRKAKEEASRKGAMAPADIQLEGMKVTENTVEESVSSASKMLAGTES